MKAGAFRTALRPAALLFGVVFVGHALFVHRTATAPVDEWADSVSDPGFLGFGPYLQAGDYYLGFSYALGAAFALWAVLQFVQSRRAAAAAGAVGGLTFVGVLMAAGCFLIGCCGSPMLGVYLGIFGAKALGAGKPLMAGVMLLSVGCGYWCLARRFAKGGCVDSCCDCPPVSEVAPLASPTMGTAGKSEGYTR